MSFFKKEPEHPIPRDWQGSPLTEQQIQDIARYFDRIESGSYSYSFLKELRDLANDSFQRAFKSNDRDRMGTIGLELQVIDYVLHTAFDGRRPVKGLQLDPKHQKYLQYLEEKALQRAIEAEKALQQEIPDDDPEEEMQQPLFKVDVPPPLVVPGLSEEVIAAFYPRSSHPQVAKIQERLERQVLNLRDALEDGEPPFILKPIERKVAATHEELVETKTRLGLQRRFRKTRARYNPRF